MDNIYKNYNPDILSTIANLSNDEVFTPPKLVNDMLDLLPEEIWRDSTVTFLDPACKTGVFLREITNRLIKGLVDEIPDLQDRVNHILTNQVFGLGITELTALMSRRSLYCSKVANGKYSIATAFEGEFGNVLFPETNHIWKNGTCTSCGATESNYKRDESLESHAYSFIHNEIEEVFGDMKFDVVIGNPPYQLNVGVKQKSFAIALYHKFVEQAKLLNPRYITMIIPSRWYAGGRGLDDFRSNMLNDKRLRVLHDYIDAKECFPTVDIKGGVCYFLWDRDSEGMCEVTTHMGGGLDSSMNRYLLEVGGDTFIRYNEAIQIVNKVQSHEEKSFSKLVSVQTPFGILSSFKDYSDMQLNDSIKLYGNKFIGYLPKDYELDKNKELLNKWKILVPKAIGSGDGLVDIVKPIIAGPNSICTQTYLVIGPFEDEEMCRCVVTYIETKFFHFMLTLKKNTQDAMRKVYEFIPMQDFSKTWTDQELYEKYQLSDGDISYIEKSIRDIQSISGNMEGGSNEE